MVDEIKPNLSDNKNHYYDNHFNDGNQLWSNYNQSDYDNGYHNILYIKEILFRIIGLLL